MPSKYDGLDASRELEQKVFADLRLAFEPRGCTVVHHGSPTGHAPGGKTDLAVIDSANKRLLHIEVTKRKGAAADGEFIAVTDHLEKAVAAGGYQDYCCFFVSPATSARMSANIRNLYNKDRARSGNAGRIIAVDFSGLEMLLSGLIEATPKLYPSARLGALFAHWSEAVDDVRTRHLIARTILGDDKLVDALSDEMHKHDADREQRLKKAIEKLENSLRDHGITGNAANTTLIYLTFLRLYEEKQEAQGNGKRKNRFTAPGFTDWSEGLASQLRTPHQNHLIEVLLKEVAEDKDLKAAGLLQVTNGQKDRLHRNVTDELIYKLVLPVFDEYEFYGSSVDILGVVFETLAGRAEKDTRVGQFFTPQEVVNFCSELAELRPLDTVLDPAVGTARFLIAAMERMLRRAAEVPGIAAEKVEKAIRMTRLIGVDLDEWVSTIAKMNMYIHGDGKSNIVNVNGLVLGNRRVFGLFPAGLTGQIDVVLTNPPLGYTSFMVAAQHWADLSSSPPSEADRIAFLESLGTVPLKEPITKESRRLDSLVNALKRRNSEIDDLSSASPVNTRKLQQAKRARDAAIEEMKKLPARASTDVVKVPEGEKLKGGALFLGAIASYLKATRLPDAPPESQGGRAVLVVDEAILNTDEYEQTRAFIRKSFFIKAVVSLGRDAFKYLAHTDAKTSILYLVRKPSEQILQREPIFFAHADNVGYSATGRWVGSELPAILQDVLAARSSIEGCYRGAAFNSNNCGKKLASLPGYHTRWYCRQDTGTGAERLDYHYARYLDLADALRASGETVVTLGDLIEPKTLLERPTPSPTNEYDCAVVQRVGVVSYKGRETMKYRSDDLWIVREGDITISGIDLVYGAAAVAGREVDGLVMSKEMFAYRVKEGMQVMPEYVAVLLRAEPVKAMILGRVSGTSNRLRVTEPQQILDVPVLAPPSLDEQERVVAMAREAADYRRRAVSRLADAARAIVERWPS